MVYRFKTGFRANVSAETAGQVCERLAQQNRLTGRDLVEESRPESAPLHRYFEWDDTKAAELYRERQGRDLIAHIIIVRDDENAETKDAQIVRAFYNVDETPKYHPVQQIITDETLHQKLLERAKAELLVFKEKYKTILELEKIINEINAFLRGGATE